MRHGKWELCNAPSKEKPCWGGIEQAAPDYRGCETPHAHNMVHIDRKGVHGSLPPPRHMERLRWQRQPSSSCKHLKEDGIKTVAEEGPGGSNTGFIRPFPGRSTFCLMDYEGKKPRSSRCKITGACLFFFCLERLCRLIAVGHVGRHPKK